MNKVTEFIKSLKTRSQLLLFIGAIFLGFLLSWFLDGREAWISFTIVLILLLLIVRVMLFITDEYKED